MQALMGSASLAMAVGGSGAIMLALAATNALSRRAAGIERLGLLGGMAAVAYDEAATDATIAMLRRLCEFFEAQDCVVAFAAPAAPGAAAVECDADALASRLLALPTAAISCRRTLGRRFARVRTPLPAPWRRAQAIAAAFEFDAALGGGDWISVPFQTPDDAPGRLCLLGARRRLRLEDVGLLVEAGTIVAARRFLEHCIEQRAEEAKTRERGRISLDLHDSTIQPYLGLRLGLEALARKLRPDDPLAADVAELSRMTQESIDELRGYVHGLDGRDEGGADFGEGLRRQAERFGRIYGIEVATQVRTDVDIEAPLADEVVRMIGESLSNVGRHTASRQVTVDVAAHDGELRAEVVDEGGDGAWHGFEPVSLLRRAHSLGGAVAVAQRGNGSAVTMTIPLGQRS